MLAGGVIRWEDVVVVVETLATSAEGNAEVLGGVDTPVIRPVAPEVSHTVDGPSDIENGDVAQDPTCKERCPATLVPVVDRHYSWYHKTEKNHRRDVQPEQNTSTGSVSKEVSRAVELTR